MESWKSHKNGHGKVTEIRRGKSVAAPLSPQILGLFLGFFVFLAFLLILYVLVIPILDSPAELSSCC